MKKAIAAAVLLALLFGAAAWNIAHIDSLTGSLTASADEALAHCRAEDYDAAEDALREAIERRGELHAHHDPPRRGGFGDRRLLRRARADPHARRRRSRERHRMSQSASAEHRLHGARELPERILSLVLQKMRQLFHEGVDILELAVDRGKADVGDLVE